MKSLRPEPFDIVDADGQHTPELAARFAAYLAGLEADADDLAFGEDYRELLAMDREDLRAVYAATTDLMNRGPAPVTGCPRPSLRPFSCSWRRSSPPAVTTRDVQDFVAPGGVR